MSTDAQITLAQQTLRDDEVKSEHAYPPDAKPVPVSSEKAASREVQAVQPLVQQPVLVKRWIDRGACLPTLQNPRSYTKWQKILIVFTVSLASFTAPFASNALLPAFPGIQASYRSTETRVSLTTTVFLLSIGISPIWHAFLSERYGRRPVYIFGFLLYIIASIFCALAPNAAALTGLRFLQAMGSSCAQSVGMGSIADIYEPAQRGRATGWWYLGPIMGPLIAPLVGGALESWLGWRAIGWFLAIWGGILWVFIVLFLPETSQNLKARQAAGVAAALLPPAPSTASARSLSRSAKVKAVLIDGFSFFIVRPLYTLTYIRFPPIGLTILLASACFASLYAVATTVTWAFHKAPYHFSPIIVSLMYIPNCVGYIIGSVVGGYLSDRAVARAREKYGDSYAPEVRLMSAWAGVPLVPAGLIIFGWSLRAGLHWTVPALGGFIFGIGQMLAIGTMMAYFADSTKETASVVACYNLVRNVAAGLIAGITPSALRQYRAGWFMTILAIVCIVFSVNLEFVRRYGPYWRQRRDEEEAEEAARQAAATNPAS